MAHSWDDELRTRNRLIRHYRRYCIQRGIPPEQAEEMYAQQHKYAVAATVKAARESGATLTHGIHAVAVHDPEHPPPGISVFPVLRELPKLHELSFLDQLRLFFLTDEAGEEWLDIYAETMPPTLAEIAAEEAKKEAERKRVEEKAREAKEQAARDREFALKLAEYEKMAFRMPPLDERTKHVWVPGLSGEGKTTLLHYMASMDIIMPCDAGYRPGVTVIDADGSLVDRLMRNMPVERVQDVIYMDLRNPIPIDFFSLDDPNDPFEQEQAVETLRAVFEALAARIGTSIGTMSTDILPPLLYTLLQATDVSFLDIHHFLKNPRRQAEIMRSPGIDPDLREKWSDFQFNGNEVGQIARLVSPLVNSPSLKVMFGCRHGGRTSKVPPHRPLRLRDVIMQKKVLLISLNGAIGDNYKIVASIVLAKLIEAALSQKADEPDRIYHMLYVDEFHKVEVSSNFDEVLNQLRKYHLCMTVAHQKFGQISDRVLDSLMGVENSYIFCLSSNEVGRLREAGLRIMGKETVDIWDKRHGTCPPQIKHLYRMDRAALVPFDPVELSRLEPKAPIHKKRRGEVRKIYTPPWDWHLGEGGERKLRPDGTPLWADYAQLIRNCTKDTYSCPGAGNALVLGDDGKPDPPTPRPERGTDPGKGKRKGPRIPPAG